MVEIKFVKVHEDAVLPCQAHSGELTGDTGYDLYAVDSAFIPARGSGVVPVGIKVGYITPGFWFKVESRSGLSFKSNMLAHPGIIDNQYRGDMGVKVYNHSNTGFQFEKGDKISQIVVYPLISAEMSWVERGQETERGDKGFGSSDVKKLEKVLEEDCQSPIKDIGVVPPPPLPPEDKILKEGQEPKPPQSIGKTTYYPLDKQ
jgi:dUTP pyrophosphatase